MTLLNFEGVPGGCYTGERTCRGCGCTDRRACPDGCSWVLLDVDTPTGMCSECAEEVEWDPRVLAEWNMP